MLARGETVGIFQVEGSGMRRALVGMQPDRFEDLIALVALYRPGPMANIPLYCARKLGKEETDYIHPRLEPILKATYGVITYQEQVMQIARDLAGYSLGEADLLRWAMGKKIRAEMEKQRVRFISGAVERGIAHADAVAIFDACAKFADYGFNKSHSAPYALITYQTAYLKANFPVEFLAASMTLDMNNTDKLNEFRLEARRLGIEVVAPDVNRSGVGVRGGGREDRLCARGAEGRRHACGGAPGAGARRSSVRRSRRLRASRRSADRESQGARMPGAGRRLRQPRSGPRKGLREHRPHPRRRAGAERADARAASPISSAARASRRRLFLTMADPWPPAERLQREFAAVGTYLSAHPIDDYAVARCRSRGGLTWKAFLDQLRMNRQFTGRIAATVVQRQERRTRTGGRIGIVTLSDPTAQFEATVYQERLSDWRELLEPGHSLFLQIGGEFDPDTEEVARAHPGARAARGDGGAKGAGDPRLPRRARADRAAGEPPRQGGGDGLRRRASQGARGGGEAPRPIPRHPAGRRRHQGGAGDRACGDAVGRDRIPLSQPPGASSQRGS